MKRQSKSPSTSEPPTTGLDQGRSRAVIENVKPEIDCGRFPAKRTVGERMTVEADIFADGHDALLAVLLYRKDGASNWTEIPMQPLVNDRWRGTFEVDEVGDYYYALQAWVDRFESWRRAFAKKVEAGQEAALDLLAGAELVEEAAKNAVGEDSKSLIRFAATLRGDKPAAIRSGLDDALAELMEKYSDRRWAVNYGKELRVNVERAKARFSAWYELFPRSFASTPGAHGTLRDCIDRLPYVAGMGFDVVYLPPIHPIGNAFRKGKNNSVSARPDDVGSPWAIGSPEGGHKSIHPHLGTLDDFRRFLAKAAGLGLEVALDIALQCSPDHPYVQQHQEWFSTRPDGTIQYAENPPKKYQDIYPLNFETPQWQALWEELKSVFLFWIEQGVRIFRVDNPHTKAFAFWEWVIAEIKQQHPDVLFLAEAFTRPNVMYRLAKLGFSQSYTYFTWRNTKQELTDYFSELTQSQACEYFRPNLWPNTPDILPEFLQVGGRASFMVRLILAATLGSSYGIYGPAFELCENAPVALGKEEYLNSEKYELKHREPNSSHSLKNLISRLNRIRKENPALQSNRSLRFHETDNPTILCYSKASDDLSSVVIVVVNLDCFHVQSGWLGIDLS